MIRNPAAPKCRSQFQQPRDFPTSVRGMQAREASTAGYGASVLQKRVIGESSL